MSNEYEKRFCTRCGAAIPPDSTFCPKCGVPVDGGTNPYASPETARPVTPGMNPLGATPLLLIGYAVFALLLAVLFIGVGMSVEDMWTGSFEEQFGPYNPIYETMYYIFAVCLIISSGMAVFSYWYTKSLSHWRNAVVTCMAATLAITPLVLGVVGIIMVMFGALITYRIYRYQSYFSS